MSSDGAESVWRLVRIFGGVAAGLVVLFGLALVTAWLATIATGLGPEDALTRDYLLLYLGGSFLAAVLAGMVASGVGRTRIAPGSLALLLLAFGAAAGGQAAQDQSGWYPLAVALLGAGGVVLGGFLAPRGGVERAGDSPKGGHQAAAGAGPSRL